ncbi:MAG: DoxX family protein [Deltaproteobacteria bacterium]|nr:DoxX family protein [Deltaproteobacteria bacterium]
MGETREVSRSIKITYWITTVLAAAIWSGGAIGTLTRAASSMEVFHRLGYPDYFSTILGSAQVLGVLAILFPISKTSREWAYAGLTFDVVSAIFSIAATRGSIGFYIFPILALTLLQTSCWTGRTARDSKWMLRP